jgi:hypothetical protein
MQLKWAPGALASLVLLLGLLPAAGHAAERPAYRAYVACAKVKEAKPSRNCSRASDKGAFFRSNARTVRYNVCVIFPTKRVLCAKRQLATKGELYVNEITTDMRGVHRVSWFVRGKRVSTLRFRVT